MGQQTMATGKIHHPPSPVSPTDPPGRFPGFIELFPGQGTGTADSPGNPVKQTLAPEQPCMPGHQSVSAGFFH
jgi:hypothetical protein